MKKFVITTAILLLAGCGDKPATDTSVSSVPANTDQSSNQAPAQAESQPQNVYQRSPVARQENRQDQQYEPSSQVLAPDEPQPVVSVYIDAPLEQPAPVLVEWAPPPMLVDVPPTRPSDDDEWTGGYWAWEGNWVWAHGRWAPPPRHDYHWNNPYYEHRGESVVFVDGFWAAPGVSFVTPSTNMHIDFAVVAHGVTAGPRPEGPAGIFVPPPPGSHRGLIVPAPLGTPPAVVVGAPPIIRGGMHIVAENNNVHTTNVTNVTNITNVTVVAPANSTATGQAVNVAVPAQPHLAAAQHPVVTAAAPEPASAKPIQAYAAGGRTPVALPPPQMVHAVVPPSLSAAHITTAVQAPSATASTSTPAHAQQVTPEPHAVTAATTPQHQPAEAAAHPTHNAGGPNHPQPNVAQPALTEKHDTVPPSPVKPAQVEKHSPPPALEAKPAHAEQRVAVPSEPAKAVQVEKHPSSAAAEAKPVPANRAEPAPQKQIAPPPKATVPINAPKPHAAPQGKPEPKEAKQQEKEKQ